jgi:hypothetical protein
MEEELEVAELELAVATDAARSTLRSSSVPLDITGSQHALANMRQAYRRVFGGLLAEQRKAMKERDEALDRLERARTTIDELMKLTANVDATNDERIGNLKTTVDLLREGNRSLQEENRRLKEELEHLKQTRDASASASGCDAHIEAGLSSSTRSPLLDQKQVILGTLGAMKSLGETKLMLSCLFKWKQWLLMKITDQELTDFAKEIEVRDQQIVDLQDSVLGMAEDLNNSEGTIATLKRAQSDLRLDLEWAFRTLEGEEKELISPSEKIKGSGNLGVRKGGSEDGSHVRYISNCMESFDWNQSSGEFGASTAPRVIQRRPDPTRAGGTTIFSSPVVMRIPGEAEPDTDLSVDLTPSRSESSKPPPVQVARRLDDVLS